MKVKIVGAYGTQLKGYGLTTFLFDGKLLLDSGGAGYGLTLDEVRKIEAVLLSHTHIDHAGGLMLLADALAIPRRRTLPIYSMPVVIEAVMKNLFNNMTWPDFTKLPSEKEPAIRFEPIQEEVPFTAGKYIVQAVRVDHSVPTTAFFVSDSRTTVLNTSDTGPTVRLWEVAKTMKALKGVLIECSFPNSLQSLADRSGHLTPRTLCNEVEKSGLKVPFLVYHLKVPFLKALKREIQEHRHPLIKLATEGKTYTF